MIMLLALPAMALVVLAHRYLQVYAPSNLLVRRVGASRPSLGLSARLLVLAGTLLVGVAIVSSAVASGAQGWLNLVVLVPAWEAINIGLLAVLVVMQRARVLLAARRLADTADSQGDASAFSRAHPRSMRSSSRAAQPESTTADGCWCTLWRTPDHRGEPRPAVEGEWQTSTRACGRLCGEG